MGKDGGVPLASWTQIGGSQHKTSVRVGAYATMGIGQVDAVVSHATARIIGMPADNALLVSAPHADVTKLEDIHTMVDKAEKDLGHLDIVCNVAGINDLCYTLAETTDELWDAIMDIDLKAPFRICREATKGMVERGHGVVRDDRLARGLEGGSALRVLAGLVEPGEVCARGTNDHGVRRLRRAHHQESEDLVHGQPPQASGEASAPDPDEREAVGADTSRNIGST